MLCAVVGLSVADEDEDDDDVLRLEFPLFELAKREERNFRLFVSKRGTIGTRVKVASCMEAEEEQIDDCRKRGKRKSNDEIRAQRVIKSAPEPERV